MSIHPDHILSVAQSLSENNLEASSRSAISRAYYAAYHTVLSTIPKRFLVNNIERSSSSHEKVVHAITAYSKSEDARNSVTITDAKRIADSLPRLKTRRKISDYDLNEHVKFVEAKRSVIEAKEIMDCCKRIKNRLAAN